MKVALLQLDLAWEDVPANHARASRLLGQAADLGARLAILPEMFATGFSMDGRNVAQAEEGATATFLRERAASLGLHVLAGVAELAEPLPANRALLVSPDGSVRRYTKIHPFSFAGEEKVMASGDAVVTWDVEGLRVTPLVCYDLRFPEPFRLAADDTDLYAVIANWPERRRHHWSLLLRARAVENLAFVAGVNRVGEGDGLRYLGDSALVGPWGETVVSAAEQETLLVADVDPAAVAEARRRFPALADRRPGSYRR
ncbi:MAG: nitrilase-related carbon-nitrogen hydrolase [Thermoanaerobaculia bacterium]|jgi:predicted amidohydrolase|nr:nitrilase-related carbon-nitrogen hydrolase [Thermoanaerobaculia bacterium]